MALSPAELNKMREGAVFARDAALYTIECARSWMDHPDFAFWRRPEYGSATVRMYLDSLEGLYAPFLDEAGQKVVGQLKATQKEAERKFKAWERTIQEKSRTGQADLF